jgi:V8-like Glu-specific endopeptidase
MLAGALILPASELASQTDIGCGQGRATHRYASAFFLDPSKPDKMVGNAFAIHAAPVTVCTVDEILCGTGGKVRWRILFATAAHVMRDVCGNWNEGGGPADGSYLYVPRAPPEQQKIPDVPRMAITKAWCSTNSDAQNYENALYRDALENDRIFKTKLVPDEIRRTSDQYFFIAEIDIPDGDLVSPFSVGPLPRSDTTKSNSASLQVKGFQNKRVTDAREMFDNVFWYQSAEKKIDIIKKEPAYIVEGWETLPGTSGSPVLQVFPAIPGSSQEGQNRYKVVGIVTNYVKPSCPEARDEADTASRATTVSAGEPDSYVVASSPQDIVKARLAATEACLSRADLQAIINRKETLYVPVLRFPDALSSRFAMVYATPGKQAPTTTSGAQDSSAPAPLLRAIRKLLEQAETMGSGDDWRELKRSIADLASELPPVEATFLFSGIANKKIRLRQKMDCPSSEHLAQRGARISGGLASSWG